MPPLIGLVSQIAIGKIASAGLGFFGTAGLIALVGVAAHFLPADLPPKRKASAS